LAAGADGVARAAARRERGGGARVGAGAGRHEDAIGLGLARGAARVAPAHELPVDRDEPRARLERDPLLARLVDVAPAPDEAVRGGEDVALLEDRHRGAAPPRDARE